MNKLRWGKFYWSDWADDPALALCSLAAQGLWMRLMCIAAQGTPYGHITINGKVPSMTDLQRLIRPKPKLEQIERLIVELERNGVAIRGPSGCLVSRRMEHDGHLAEARRGAAKERWKRADRSPIGVQSESDRTPFSIRNDPANDAGKAESGSDLHMQNSGFACTESTETQNPEREPPVAPPTKGGRRRRSSSNGKDRGWTQSVINTGKGS